MKNWEPNDQSICPVCGVIKYKTENTFRFSYKPNKVISSDDVAGLICSNVQKSPDRSHLFKNCINQSGDPTLGDTWDKRWNTPL
jgi:hypothetical protein